MVDGWGQRKSVEPGMHRNGVGVVTVGRLVVVALVVKGCGHRVSVDPG